MKAKFEQSEIKLGAKVFVNTRTENGDINAYETIVTSVGKKFFAVEKPYFIGSKYLIENGNKFSKGMVVYENILTSI